MGTPRTLIVSVSAPDIQYMALLRQVGALCVRGADDGKPQVLLVTSRETGRWVIPKGWPRKQLADHDAAAREATEEAGVSGRITNTPIGSFQYNKRLDDGARLIRVSVFLLFVKKQKNRWPEQHQRQRAWLSVDLAAKLIAEPDLKTLILSVATQNVDIKKIEPVKS